MEKSTNLDFRLTTVAQNVKKSASIVECQKHSSWSFENQAILLTCQTNNWCVDNWHQLFRVQLQHTIKQTLVVILEITQEHVLSEVLLDAAQVFHCNANLQILRSNGGWQQTFQFVDLPLSGGESKVLIQKEKQTDKRK